MLALNKLPKFESLDTGINQRSRPLWRNLHCVTNLRNRMPCSVVRRDKLLPSRWSGRDSAHNSHLDWRELRDWNKHNWVYYEFLPTAPVHPMRNYRELVSIFRYWFLWYCGNSCNFQKKEHQAEATVPALLHARQERTCQLKQARVTAHNSRIANSHHSHSPSGHVCGRKCQ